MFSPMHFFLCTQHEPTLSRYPHYPYKYIEQKPTQNPHKEIYHIFGAVNRIRYPKRSPPKERETLQESR